MTGYFGHIPIAEGKVAANLPGSFLGPWGTWLDAAIAESRLGLGNRWLDTYLISPIWRFALFPGLCGDDLWVGVLMPSVDQQNVHFPLTVVAAARRREQLLQSLVTGGGVWDDLEQLALSCLSDGFVRADLDRGVEELAGADDLYGPQDTRPTREAWPVDAPGSLWSLTDPRVDPWVWVRLAAVAFAGSSPPYSIWYSAGSGPTSPSLLACQGLPPPSRFAAMLDGSWPRSRRPAVPRPGERRGAEAGPQWTAARDGCEGVRWTSSWRSDVGKVRTVNEDACLSDAERGVWVVADGLGGHLAGNLASRQVVEAFRDFSTANGLAEAGAEAKRRLVAVNGSLRRRGGSDITATTVVALLTVGCSGVLLWAGDSRAYLYRDGALRLMTRDHTPANELAEDDASGQSEAVAGAVSEVITRAVGADDALDLDTVQVDVREGDLYLLCTDGLTKEVSDDELGVIVRERAPVELCEELVAAALARGGRDNVTVVATRAALIEDGATR